MRCEVIVVSVSSPQPGVYSVLSRSGLEWSDSVVIGSSEITGNVVTLLQQVGNSIIKSQQDLQHMSTFTSHTADTRQLDTYMCVIGCRTDSLSTISFFDELNLDNVTMLASLYSRFQLVVIIPGKIIYEFPYFKVVELPF